MGAEQEFANRDWRMLIAGDLVEAQGGKVLQVWNPSRGEALSSVPLASQQDVDRAVAAAKAASHSWWMAGPMARGALLRKLGALIRENSEELAWLDSANGGNPLQAMRNDVMIAAARCDDVASLLLEVKGQTIPATNPGDLHYTVREPFGVAGIIMPYNHPALFTMQVAGPLGVGNTVVFKGSDQAPLSSLRIAELCAEVFPPGVVNILSGDGATTGSAIAAHPDIRLINFTGSEPTARRIMEIGSHSAVKTYIMELGGKNPLIVCPDADLDRAVNAAVEGMNLTMCQGQSCVSTSRVLLHSSIKTRFIEEFKAKLELLTQGDAVDPTTEIGPLVTHRHRDRVLEYIEKGKKQGARLVTGGTPPSQAGLTSGAYLTPTLFDQVLPEMIIAQEEIFGPVVSAIEWDTEEQALQIANGVDYGLTAAVWTRDIDRAQWFSANLDAGRVFVKSHVRFFPRTPIGFRKDSGVGTDGGLTGLENFTQVKTVHLMQQ